MFSESRRCSFATTYHSSPSPAVSWSSCARGRGWTRRRSATESRYRGMPPSILIAIIEWLTLTLLNTSHFSADGAICAVALSRAFFVRVGVPAGSCARSIAVVRSQIVMRMLVSVGFARFVMIVNKSSDSNLTQYDPAIWSAQPEQTDIWSHDRSLHRSSSFFIQTIESTRCRCVMWSCGWTHSMVLAISRYI
jgi:hypothetical protein